MFIRNKIHPPRLIGFGYVAFDIYTLHFSGKGSRRDREMFQVKETIEYIKR